jgi:hypothetical protein
MQQARPLSFAGAMLALTAGSLLMRRLRRTVRAPGVRAAEAPVRGGAAATSPTPLTAPVGILVRRPDHGRAQPQGDVQVMVRWEAELPQASRRVAFVTLGGPRRVRPREVRNGRFGKPRNPEAPA